MKTEQLLYELCVTFGFSLPPVDISELIAAPPSTSESFVDEVIRREGLDPVYCDTDLIKAMRTVVARHMGDPAPTWPRDRRRGKRR